MFSRSVLANILMQNSLYYINLHLVPYHNDHNFGFLWRSEMTERIISQFIGRKNNYVEILFHMFDEGNNFDRVFVLEVFLFEIQKCLCLEICIENVKTESEAHWKWHHHAQHCLTHFVEGQHTPKVSLRLYLNEASEHLEPLFDICRITKQGWIPDYIHYHHHSYYYYIETTFAGLFFSELNNFF